MPKQKPIFEFTLLTQEQKDQIYTWRFEDELSLLKTKAAILEKFGLKISKNKVDAQCQRWQFAEALGISEEDALAMLNGEPVTLNADGLQAVRQKALLMTMKDDLYPAQLKILQSIFDYDFRKEVIQTRLQLAKNRDARAQNNSDRADKLASHKIEMDRARFELSRQTKRHHANSHVTCFSNCRIAFQAALAAGRR